MKQLILALFCLCLVFMICSCASIKPWERVYLNDPQMQLEHTAGKSFSNYVHSIREGSMPAGSTKSSGGCGCY